MPGFSVLIATLVVPFQVPKPGNRQRENHGSNYINYMQSHEACKHYHSKACRVELKIKELVISVQIHCSYCFEITAIFTY